MKSISIHIELDFMKVRKVPMIPHPYVLADLTLSKYVEETNHTSDEESTSTKNTTPEDPNSPLPPDHDDTDADQFIQELRKLAASDRDLYERVSKSILFYIHTYH
jgi:hypothetical protein